jgi:membrane protease YdiL (CAAX protease family)
MRLRSGSTWPGVLAHLGNNTLALLVVRLFAD